MSEATSQLSAAAEAGDFSGEVPCGDHAFDDALVCRCGVSWWAHQRLPVPCPLNARGRNRGEESAGIR